MTKLVNLTPHPITVFDADGAEIINLPSAGNARLGESKTIDSAIDLDGATVPVGTISHQAGEGIPEPQDDVLYVVSTLTALGVPREDFLSPADFVRDESGRILGCRSLVHVQPSATIG